MPGTLRILCLGDVVGRPGRLAVKRHLAAFRAAYAVDMTIANGENAAGGIGLTPETLRELFAAGVDVVTGGNHIWKHRELYPTLDANPRVLRPLNYGSKTPGRGFLVHALPPAPDGGADGGGASRDAGVGGSISVGVLNLLGRTFMAPADCPFAAAERALDDPSLREARCIIVDFHAEASSEKRAMAHFLDGRVTAVLGTHTHVQTADARVSAAGTASLTDLGMCGVEGDSVIGMAKEKVLARMLTGLPHPFIPARGEGTLNGALIEIDGSSGKALSIRLVRDNAASVLAIAPGRVSSSR